MSIAVVGGGFCGLAVCWHLLQTGRYQVTLLDRQGIGAGASGMSAGLVHPYPGEQGRRSIKADEGLLATKELIRVAEKALGKSVANQKGIIRLVQGQEPLLQWKKKSSLYPDILPLSLQDSSGEFLITSGLTVYPKLYLEGLWKACLALGARFSQRKVGDWRELSQYDKKVFTVGAGIRELGFESLPLSYLKGQLLTCTRPSSFPLEKSLTAKGYIAVGESEELCYVGSTYERDFTSEEPCIETAKKLLLPPLRQAFREVSSLEVVACRAGIRVVNQKHYLPFFQKVGEDCWVLTGMGSRGLLYHAYFAELLVADIVQSRGA